MIDLALQFWQFTTVFGLIIIAWIISLVHSQKHKSIGFKYKEMPHMKPLPIPTKGKGFWGGVWTWIMATRQWEITKDFHYSMPNSVQTKMIEHFVIPKGFVFDGASVPKFFRSWLSPMGVLLIGGLVHDYGYKYQTLLMKGKKTCHGLLCQKDMDIIFRDINIDINGFRVINYLAYYALRLGGFVAWNGHRKRGADWKASTCK